MRGPVKRVLRFTPTRFWSDSVCNSRAAANTDTPALRASFEVAPFDSEGAGFARLQAFPVSAQNLTSCESSYKTMPAQHQIAPVATPTMFPAFGDPGAPELGREGQERSDENVGDTEPSPPQSVAQQRPASTDISCRNTFWGRGLGKGAESAIHFSTRYNFIPPGRATGTFSSDQARGGFPTGAINGVSPAKLMCASKRGRFGQLRR